MSSSQFEAFVGRTRHRIEPINWFLASSLVIALAAAWPLLSQSGFLNTRGGGDSPFLLQRVQQLGAALADGHFPVRWMPDACYGYGYPFFNFYAPLSIYFTSVINLLGVGLVWAVKISQLLGFVAGAWAIFALGRRWFGSGWAGLLTSAAYTLAPFHMVNVYVRGDSLAEFWAMAFFPVTILLADDLTRALLAQVSKRRMRAALLFSLSIAALILSHNISALIFTPFILLYFGLVLAFRQDGWATGNSESNSRPSALVWYFGALAAGMLLSSWFWLPAIVERSLAQLAPVTSGYFRFTNHFRGLDLIQLDFLFDYDAAGGRAFSMGVLQAIAALAGAAVIIYHLWRGRKDPTASGSTASRPSLASVLFIVITLVTATFMITPLSKPLWELLPFLEFTQFPWRFLSIQAFAAALAAGGLALLPWRKILVPVTVLLISVSALAGLQPDFTELSDVDLSPKNLAQYEWFTANIGSTVSAEYLPETVMPRPYTSSWLNESDRNSAVILDGHGSSVELVDRSTSRQIWRTDISATRATVAFPVLYWPGWTAEVDGEEFAIEPASGSGMIKIDLPSGEHEVEISLGRTTVRWLGEIISLLVLGAMVALAIRSRSAGWWRGLLTALLAAIILVVIGQLLPSLAMDSNSHSWDFAQLSYLHPNTDGISFEDGSLLRKYTYNREEVAPGDELLISFSWDPPPSAEVTLDLVTPAVNRSADAPPLVFLSSPADYSEYTVKLPIPENAPAGMYLPRLVIDGAPALTSSGSPRGPLFLQPRPLEFPI